jgi:hypothetical protein
MAALLALLAGYLAWLFIPCQPLGSVPVPAGTKLLEFSPGGRYAVTFHRGESRLALWQPNPGQEVFATQIACTVYANETAVGARSFYGFSADDRLMAVTTGTPDEPRLNIVDLDSGNTSSLLADLPANPEKYRPRPAFSTDGRYLSYFSQDAQGKDCAIVYDVVAKQEHLRIAGVFGSLGPPTRQRKWFLCSESVIEFWDIDQKRKEGTVPWSTLAPLPRDAKNIINMDTSLSSDGQTIIALCEIKSPSWKEGFFQFRFDLTRRATKSGWKYSLPPSARLFWNVGSSDPVRFLLIKTLDDQGSLVQDLVDVNSGEVLVRFPRPVSFSHGGQAANREAGFAQSLGRTGEIVIDAERKVLVSKQISWPFWWDWDQLHRPLAWLGVNSAPVPHLQFHSAQTAELLEHHPHNQFDSVLAMHPTEPLLAVIDEKDNWAQLQFWRVPPPKPWGWIIASALVGGAIAFLLRVGFSKWRRSSGVP